MSLLPSKEWSNARLVEECVRGNEQAWCLLVDRYKNLMYSIPLRYGAPQQDAADIFQAVCLDLFNELPRIRDAEALQGWLIRVTTHKCYRWKRQQNPVRGDWEDRQQEQPSGDELPSNLLMELEREQLVRDAIAQLPPRCREMIEMLFFQQPPVSYAEVAQRLRLATGSIGFIRGRCLKRLKQILEDKGF
jgi:RNA polymerase sigma factor (sigma-70 family)